MRLKDLYYNPKQPNSFSSPERLFLEARKYRPNIKRKTVNAFLNRQKTYTTHKRVTKKLPKYRKTLTRRLDYIWQSDLIVQNAIYRQNSHYKYILVCIDVLSRYAWTRPLKNKTGLAVVQAFNSIIQQSGRKPVKIMTDRGGEYYNSHFQDFCARNGILHYSSYSKFKSAIAERFNRTILSKIYKYFTWKNTKRWVDKLQDFTDSYNATVHRAHGFRPDKINLRNQNRVWRKLYRDYLRNNNMNIQPYFRRGDKVRLSINKGIFEKGYKKTFSDELYTVDRVVRTNPITYKLRDSDNEELLGSYYKEDLSKFIE